MQWSSVTIDCNNCFTTSLTLVLFIVVPQRPTRCWGPTWCCPPAWWSWGPGGVPVGPGSAAAPWSTSPRSRTLLETPAAAPPSPSDPSTGRTASSGTDTLPSPLRYARLQNKSPAFLWKGYTPEPAQVRAPSK